MPTQRTVLMVAYSLERAGAEQVVLSLTKGLDRKRFRPVVCGLRGGVLLPALQAQGIPTYVLERDSSGRAGVLSGLRRVIRVEQPQLVHSHNFSANLWGRVAAVLEGVPIRVATEHTMADIKRPVHRALDKLLARSTTRVVCVSQRVRASVLSILKIPPEKVVVIHNGVEVPAGLPVPATIRRRLDEALGLPANAPLVVAVGRLEPPKGFDTLLESARFVLRQRPDARFLIVGDGHLGPRLRHLAVDLDIAQRCLFTGHREDARELLAAASVVVNSSRREGFSITILEAMSVAAPIVATDVGGNAEAIVHAESGLIVTPGDPRALAEAILAVLSDPGLAQRLGANAVRRYERFFTLDSMVRATEDLYGLLSDGPRA